MTPVSSPASNATRSLQRRCEIEFPAHRPLGDRGDLRLDPGVICQFVDAFLTDDRRIHVGDEQSLPAVTPGWTMMSTPSHPSIALRARQVACDIDRSAASPSSIQSEETESPPSRRAPRASSLSSSRPAAISVTMSKAPPPLALIAGPTASGKSALALALAERRAASSSMPTAPRSTATSRSLAPRRAAGEQARAEHRLYGIARWRPALFGGRLGGSRQARDRATCSAREAADPGWRHRALSSDAARRHRPRAADRSGNPQAGPFASAVEDNRAELQRSIRRAADASIPADTTRIARALEVVISTGRTLASGKTNARAASATQSTLRPLILLPPRDWLYARCDARFEAMIEQGAMAEVERLLDRQLDRQSAGHARHRRARDCFIPARRNGSRDDDRRRPTGHPPLRQAAIYLVRPPAAARIGRGSPNRWKRSRYRRAGADRATP